MSDYIIFLETRQAAKSSSYGIYILQISKLSVMIEKE